MKNLIIGILSFLVLSIAYVVSGLDIFGFCWQSTSNFSVCNPIAYAESVVTYPALFITMHSPVKFIWGDENDGIGVIRAVDRSYGGLKLGNRVIIQTWEKSFPI